MKALVAGWFSFERMGATAGDLLARDIACSWLGQAGVEYDIAHAAPFPGGINWRLVNPSTYSHVVFVCGPCGNGPPMSEFQARFAGCCLVGLDLTMLEPLEAWNPFDLLLERDSSATARPDISFLSDAPLVPVVGLCFIHPQPEYGLLDFREQANRAIRRLVDIREVATVEIDTRLDENLTGLRSPAEIESLIARMDLVLTTRLHGMVLALKNGVPAIAVDPVNGGAKITRQARTVGWPLVFPAEVSRGELARAFDYCLTNKAPRLAQNSAARARQRVVHVRDAFVEIFAPD